MADDQRPDSDATEDSENRPARRGLGRFASRFRREPEEREEPEQPNVSASPSPEDEDASWLLPATLDRASATPGPEPLAPELDLTRTPPTERGADVEAAPRPPSEEPERASTQEELPAVETEDGQPEESPEPDPEPTTDRSLPTTGRANTQPPEPVAPAVPPAQAPEPALASSPVLVAPESDEFLPDDQGPATSPRTRPAAISAHLAVLTAVATSIIMAFLLIEPSPRWLLLLGAAAVVFGLDGTLRQTWRTPFSLGQETAPFLFVPALYMMAVPVLIEHNVSGELVFLVGLGAGFGFGALAWAEIASVRSQAPEYEQARVIVTANTYLTGFAIFSLSYVFEIGLLAAIVATSIAAAMLAVEVLREGEIDPMETLGLSLVTGVIIGEARWLLYYIPLDTYLAGLTLLLLFYLATGLLHSHVIRALNRVVAVEHSGIAAAGLALVILARAVGLA